MLNVALTRVTKSKGYFSIKPKPFFGEGSLPKIEELLKRASNVDALKKLESKPSKL